MELEKLLEKVICLILTLILIVLLLLILLRKFYRVVQRILKSTDRAIFILEVIHHGNGVSLGILKLRANTLLLRVSWLALICGGILLAVSKGRHIPVRFRL